MPALFQSVKGGDQGLHIDKLIPNLLKDRGSPNKFAHTELFFGVPVEKMTDLIGRIDNDNSITLYNAQPAGAEGLLDRVSFNVRRPISYELQTFGLESLIPNVTAGAADGIFDYAARQGAFVYDRIRLRLEYAAIPQTIRNAALMTFNFTVPAAQQWSNRTSPSSNPIDDMLTWVRFVREESNRPIYKIYMINPVWLELQQHPVSIGRADVTTYRMVTPEIIEKLLDVAPGTLYIDHYGIYKTPGLGAKRYFGGPDVVILTGEPPSRSDNSFGHMYFLGGSQDEPIVTLRYPEFRVARFAEVVQTTAFVHFFVEEPTAAFVAFNVVDPSLARFRGMLSS
jgi:hypothetical protein